MNLIQQIKKDCYEKGHGRKQWWAKQLKIPPLTLSHWLSGRQKPNGQHSLDIQKILNHKVPESFAQAWKNYLWEIYYSKKELEPKALSLIILEVLSAEDLDTRTLALLSYIVGKKGKKNLPFVVPSDPQLRNRLGWLLESSGQKPPFLPAQTYEQLLAGVLPKTNSLRRYFLHHQTMLGKKWKIVDSPLDSLKQSFV